VVVDLAPITDPDLVPVAVIRALGLPDQQGRSTMELLLRFVGDRRILLVLDNCEHLLDACAALIVALQGGCPEVTVTAAEICGRLDGVPLAIELAAARVRVLSLAEIRDSLHDRFRLLTGGARTAVRRQQTLRASVDWSHALLTEPERVVFAPLPGPRSAHTAGRQVSGRGRKLKWPNAILAVGDGAPVRAGKTR
jgi:predicted ATPase